MKKFKFEKETLSETKKYMKEIIDNLADNNGMINGEWYLSLKILEENVNIYFGCVNGIKEEGLLITSRLGDKKANPLLKIKNDIQVKIITILNDFALTKKAQIKLLNEDDSDVNSPLSNFLLGKKEYR